jgi:hypothetical protein
MVYIFQTGYSDESASYFKAELPAALDESLLGFGDRWYQKKGRVLFAILSGCQLSNFNRSTVHQ